MELNLKPAFSVRRLILGGTNRHRGRSTVPRTPGRGQRILAPRGCGSAAAPMLPEMMEQPPVHPPAPAARGRDGRTGEVEHGDRDQARCREEFPHC